MKVKLTGYVNWFQHGHGFITPDLGNKDIFVHFKGIAGNGYRTLEKYQRVSFELGENHLGTCAVNVEPETVTDEMLFRSATKAV